MSLYKLIKPLIISSVALCSIVLVNTIYATKTEKSKLASSLTKNTTSQDDTPWDYQRSSCPFAAFCESTNKLHHSLQQHIQRYIKPYSCAVCTECQNTTGPSLHDHFKKNHPGLSWIDNNRTDEKKFTLFSILKDYAYYDGSPIALSKEILDKLKALCDSKGRGKGRLGKKQNEPLAKIGLQFALNPQQPDYTAVFNNEISFENMLNDIDVETIYESPLVAIPAHNIRTLLNNPVTPLSPQETPITTNTTQRACAKITKKYVDQSSDNSDMSDEDETSGSDYYVDSDDEDSQDEMDADEETPSTQPIHQIGAQANKPATPLPSTDHIAVEPCTAQLALELQNNLFRAYDCSLSPVNHYNQVPTLNNDSLDNHDTDLFFSK